MTYSASIFARTAKWLKSKNASPMPTRRAAVAFKIENSNL